ncbi:MAG: AAA family ATPase, partial [Planctomycetota bacterium]
ELLQKFISLCDAQRKMEGVYKGRTRTYDLRGRKVAVVMAGNPYTESGERFQIPDMLANRADVYNLGEIIGDTADVFEMSYLENALTSNPVLGKLAARSHRDVYSVIKIAETGDAEGVDLEGAYSPEELQEMVDVMGKMSQVRDVVLKVNREYMRSAAMADEYRTEPPFKLQGSYRNMNRIAEKVSPIMNDQELQTLIISSYENDVQTLTSDNESNLLKFKQLMGVLTDEERARWEHIVAAFARKMRLHGIDADNPLGQAVVQLGAFSDGLEAIRRAVTDGVEQVVQTNQHADANGEQNELAEQIGELVEALASSAAGEPASATPTPTDATEAIPQKVIVQHNVPRVILRVVKAQFELMNNWMAPLLAAENLQASEMQQLRNSIDKCLKDYAKLMAELKEANDDDKPAKKKKR